MIGASQTRLDYLPEHATDFAFASLAEQRGFVGCAILLLLYLLVVWRGLRVITGAGDLYGVVVAGGLVVAFLFQVFVNVGMTMGVAPVTGIPLPFVTVGGSSMVANLVLIGVLQSIHARGELGRGVRMKAAGVARFAGELKSLGLTAPRGDLTGSRRADRRQRRPRRPAREGARSRGGAGRRRRRRRPARSHARKCLVRIIAGDPTPEDEELVRAAATHGVPVVIVELWPQADWTQPFVLSPFVVECRAGRGLSDSRDRRSDRRGDGGLARRSRQRFPPSPTPRARALVKQAVIRSALIGAGSEPVRRVAAAHLARAGAHGRRGLRRVSSAQDDGATSARSSPAGAAAVLASGFAFRRVARSARGGPPDSDRARRRRRRGHLGLAKALERASSRAFHPTSRTRNGAPSGPGPRMRRDRRMGATMPNTELAEELLQLEEADAWFEYLESTRGQSETRYSELEPWAWARLSQRLRAVRARRSRLRPAAA